MTEQPDNGHFLLIGPDTFVACTDIGPLVEMKIELGLHPSLGKIEMCACTKTVHECERVLEHMQFHAKVEERRASFRLIQGGIT